MEIHERLKNLRNENHLTQEALAERIHVSRQTISNWETGKSYPDIQSLLLLCDLYRISLNELVERDVENMNKQLIKRSIYFHTTFMSVGLVLFFFLVANIRHIGMFSLLLSYCCIAISAISGFQVEKIKKKYHLQRYKNLKQFLNTKYSGRGS